MAKSNQAGKLTKRPNKQYYGLDEAEKLLEMSTGTLIHMGARQDLPLYVMAQNWAVRYRSRTIVHGEQIDPPNDESWPQGQPALTDRLITPVRLYQEALARYEFDNTATTRNFFVDNKYQPFFQPETGKHVYSWNGVSNDSNPSQQTAVSEDAAGADHIKEQLTPETEISRQIYEFEIPLSSLPPGTSGIAIASCAMVIMAKDLPQMPVEAAPTPTTAASATEKEAPTSKAPNLFISSLIQLLVEISRRAASAEPPRPFSTEEMPGVKADLRELADKFDMELKHPESTFHTYIKGLIKFKPGAQPTDFYKQLFPENFK